MKILGAVLFMMGLLTTARFVPTTRYWVVDLASHFPVQYGVICLALIPVCVRQSRFGLGGFLCFLAMVNFAVLSVPPSKSRHSSTSGQAIRLYTANVLVTNCCLAPLIRDINKRDPDVVFLQEITPKHAARLQKLMKRFPHSYQGAMPGYAGSMLLSKWPILEIDVMKAGKHAARPMVKARLEIEKTEVLLFGLHPSAPSRPSKFRERNDQFAWMADQVSDATVPVIVMGDLNVTPYSPVFRNMLERSGLRDTRSECGWYPSWPAPAPFLGIPIDHILVSSEVEVKKMSRGPFIWSDHYPLIVDISI